MTTVGYLFLLLGGLLIRQVAVGRAKDIPSDIRDLTVGFLNADPAAMSAVLAQRGTNVAVADPESGSGTESVTAAPGHSSSALATRMMQLGKAAKGYRLGATGPTYYDCSGLVWRAAHDLDLYSGGRFTTSTFHAIAKTWVTRIDGPAAEGDLLLWPTHHIGVSLGGDTMYSARSTAKGIGTSSVSGDASYFGSQPEIWRVNS